MAIGWRQKNVINSDIGRCLGCGLHSPTVWSGCDRLVVPICI